MHLFLASSSPRRRELLAEAGYEFDVVEPSEAAECGACSGMGPIDLVAELAVRKAADVVARLLASRPDRSAIVIAADTVAECQGQILGKPSDEVHARQMLQMLSGREHRVYTGLCIWPLAAGDFKVEVDSTTLHMDALTPAQLDEYVAGGQWHGKAGGFGYQDHLGWIHIVEGSESNVVGLPMERLKRMLANLIDESTVNHGPGNPL